MANNYSLYISFFSLRWDFCECFFKDENDEILDKCQEGSEREPNAKYLGTTKSTVVWESGYENDGPSSELMLRKGNEVKSQQNFYE